jgi:hypothetical protein
VIRDHTGNPEGDSSWDPSGADVPGYEFEPGRPRPAPRPRPRQPAPQQAQPPRGEDPYRLRYTPTVSAGEHEPLPHDRPGYEFDGAFPVARRSAPYGHGQHGHAHRGHARRGPVPPRQPAAPAAGPGGAHAEWTRLLRSLLPQPEKTSLARQFLANLEFRGWGMRVALPIVSMVTIGIAVVVVLGVGGSTQAPSLANLGFPPAALAGHDFTAAAAGTRGVTASLGRIASDGAVAVAVGAETGVQVPRAEFFISQNDGGSWSLATESAAGGGAPPPGHAARLVAGGQGKWVAVGSDAIWTSTTGAAWTLISTTGLPDSVSVLRRTSSGFIAAGGNAVYLSATGATWTELPGPYGVIDIRYLAADGNTVLLAGDAPGGVSGAWLSGDGGHTWTPLAVPTGHGASDQIAGVAVVGSGFALVRPALSDRRAAADVYRSADGTDWAFAASLLNFTPEVMNGGPDGAVITGDSAGTPFAVVSAGGAQWYPTALGSAPGASGGQTSADSSSVAGAAITDGGAVVAVTGPGGPRLVTVRTGGLAVPVSLSAIPGAVEPQLAVIGIAAHGSAQVAVGSANGYPAAWLSTDGGSAWTQATGQTPAVLGRPGTQQLVSVTYGGAGWLAVGGVTGGTTQHPVVLTSADGSTWSAADGDPAFAGSDMYTEQAAASSRGYVVVGYQQLPGEPALAAAWWSSDMTSWQEDAPAELNGADGASGSREMLAVVAGMPGGGFVAVGTQGNAPAAWTSVDGRNWTSMLLPLPSGAASAALLHVTLAGGTIVAAGLSTSSDGVATPFAARSVNGGMTWTESSLPVPAGQAKVTALAAAGGTFTVTGTFGTTPGHQDVVVWTSSDGSHWTAATPGGEGLAGPGIQAITGLTVSGATLTGVGYTASPQSDQPLFWQSPIR